MPSPMQITDSSTIAACMFHGGSRGLSPESFWKNTYHGNLMPACRNTPAEAAVSRNHTSVRCDSAAAEAVSDLLMKPEVSGKAEMASAPMVPQIVVNGMLRNRPPSSEHLFLPVWWITAPALMNSSAL